MAIIAQKIREMQLSRKKWHRIYIWWQQLSQLWQFWKKYIYGSFLSTIVAIMAILKKKRIQLTPDDTIVAIVAIVEKKKQKQKQKKKKKKQHRTNKQTNMNPGDNNCRIYGNSEKSWWHQLSQLWQLWKRYSWLLMTAIVAIVANVEKQIWIPVTTIVAIMEILKIAKIASLCQSSRLSSKTWTSPSEHIPRKPN